MFWIQRFYGVKQKLRAAVLAMAGVAMISMTIATFVVVNPYAAQANETPNIWITPGTMKVIPYFDRDGDLQPAGYIVSDTSYVNLCRMMEDDSAYTCQRVDLRR